MDEPEHVHEAMRWLKYAREDLQTARLILAHPPISSRHVCSLSQQAVEKALKAALIFLETDFPRSHDLDILCGLLPNDWQVRELFPDLAALTEWAVESRYPGDWPEAIEADAFAASEQAGQILKTIEADLHQRGMQV